LNHGPGPVCLVQCVLLVWHTELEVQECKYVFAKAFFFSFGLMYQ